VFSKVCSLHKTRRLYQLRLSVTNGATLQHEARRGVCVVSLNATHLGLVLIILKDIMTSGIIYVISVLMG
jgi:hypothetical protein